MLMGKNIKNLGRKRLLIKVGMGLLYKLNNRYRLDYVIEYNKSLYSLDSLGNTRRLQLSRYEAIVIPVLKNGELCYDYKNNMNVKVIKLK